MGHRLVGIDPPRFPQQCRANQRLGRAAIGVPWCAGGCRCSRREPIILGLLFPVLSVAVLADLLAAAPDKGVDNHRRRHLQVSRLLDAMATVKLSPPIGVFGTERSARLFPAAADRPADAGNCRDLPRSRRRSPDNAPHRTHRGAWSCRRAGSIWWMHSMWQPGRR